ncbi:urea amidolyase family protein [Acinetobacter nectaris]|uniref:5-oxoprolinase subunit B/C family protein n=1 Tax=Acinetobacter nectaris TaxID=1219382 RepID=UPI001F23328A|nr:urea amidolyase family protein [Acinetobacter nectaris]MCF8999882.1 5-oxoprolinase/urea amidolyase family protein [Acinetobacter nectaris]MCF9027365.1 5-oxoprolinase/urea amidolyase family protein [Acinetobacter nectaris]
MRFLSVSVNSFLIEFKHLSETTNFFRQLKQLNHPAILDMIPAEKTIFIQFSNLIIQQKELIDWLSKQEIKDLTAELGREVVIPVSYQGMDLGQVAEFLGITVNEVIRRHTESEWKVAFIGFAPGFGYLNSENKPFGSIPRLNSPRKQIPMGSVALAGEYAGIYPKNSPGGWQLIGHTDERMWDIHRDPPALLLPGNRIFFKKNTQGASVFIDTEIKTQNIYPNQNLEKIPVLKVLKVGIQVLIQDYGRQGKFALGVGVGGAMDKGAMQYANECVGNPLNYAVLEILNGGFHTEVQCSTVIAVTGADTDLYIKYKDGETEIAKTYQSIALDQGDEIIIKSPKAGLRSYFAIRGGIAVNDVLGSKSFDTLAELGPQPLKANDYIYTAQMMQNAVLGQRIKHDYQLPKPSETVVLDIVLGPRVDWFDKQSLETLKTQSWLVTSDINRIGLRLMGEKPLKRAKNIELPSEGTAIGALQIPPNGQPVLFMNDHPLTGGYPVIATVADYHLDLVAQIPTGCMIKFNPISDFMDIRI